MKAKTKTTWGGLDAACRKRGLINKQMSKQTRTKRPSAHKNIDLIALKEEP